MRTGVQKFLIEPKKSMQSVDKNSFFADVLDSDRILTCTKERFMSVADLNGKIIKTFGLEDKT